MRDRVPTYPGRVQLTPVAGQTNIYDMIRADEPTEPGDPLNKANLLPDAVATALGLTGDAVVAEALAKLSVAALRKVVTLSDLEDGGEFKLIENGGLVTYIKLKTDYENSGRILIVRKDAIATVPWNSGGTNAYSGSTLDTYLNSTYIGYLDSATQCALSNVNIPYTVGNGNNTVTTLARKCFALSFTELGLTNANVNTEGTAISYFSTNTKRIAYNNGVGVFYHTRTPDKTGTVNAGVVGEYGTGAVGIPVTQTTRYARPALTLPPDYKIFGGTSLTDMSGNDFPLPYAKIATGSYTGTGTFGSDSKNSLAFDFPPKVLLINGGKSTNNSSTDRILIADGRSKVAYGASGSIVYVSTSGNTITWWSTDSQFNQLNASGIEYNYVAIG